MKKPLLILCMLAIGSASMAQQKESKSKTKDVLTIQVAVRDHGYPVMKNTGNADADYLEYKNAKIQWKAKNPSLHSQMYPKRAISKQSNRKLQKSTLQKISNTN